MMGRQNNDRGPLFYEFRLDEAVPADHLARKIDAVLDLSWVHTELAPHYPTLGRPSVDPVPMIRMLIARKLMLQDVAATNFQTLLGFGGLLLALGALYWLISSADRRNPMRASSDDQS